MAVTVSDNSSSVIQEEIMKLQVLVTKQFISYNEYMDIGSVLLIVGFIIACFGIFTNIVNIETFLSMGVLDSVTTLFLSISCTDLAYVTFTAMRNAGNLLIFLERSRGVWLMPIDPQVPAFFCDNCAFVMYSISVLTGTFLAIARCMCVAKPLHFKGIFTQRNCFIALIPIYLFPIVSQIAIFVHMGARERFDVGKNSSRIAIWLGPGRKKVKDVVGTMFGFVIPFATQIIVVVCVVIMTFKLKESAKFRAASSTTANEGSSNKMNTKDRQVVKQVVLISTIYIALNLPKLCTTLLVNYDRRFQYGSIYQNLFLVFHLLKIDFELINASVNIFVYYFFNSKFRSLCFSCKKDK